MSLQNTSAVTASPGLETRLVAMNILSGVLERSRPLDEQLEVNSVAQLAERDRALMRTIVSTSLRQLGVLRHVLAGYLDRGLPRQAPQVETILLVGATQILFLDVPDHAAVDLSVRLAQSDRGALHYSGLINAVLRRLTKDGKTRLAGLDAPRLNTPDWLWRRWNANYGEPVTRAMAVAHAQEPALDISVKSDPEGWAQKLGGRVLPSGTVRLIASGPVTRLPGFDEGEWWVQDAAASLPARLFGDVRGKTVADLCAAPGGKTAQLALTGAHVTAVDRSASRLMRLHQNLNRLKLAAEVVEADAAQWQGGPFDAVLVDAPCSATGTIRRHPDVQWLKTESDVAKLAALQSRLLDRAAALVKPGGTLVYCTCSLEPEECESQIAALLARTPSLSRRRIGADEVGGNHEFITALGDLRTLPSHMPDADPKMAGVDGFYAARISKI